MALVNVHPDYLRKPTNFAIYKDFLQAMKEKRNYWHALPRDVARWWQQRMLFKPELQDNAWNLADLPGATMASIVLGDGGEVIIRCEDDVLNTGCEEDI
jgi:hypothetical protein